MTPLDLVYDCRLRMDDEGGNTGTVISPNTYYWEQSDSGCLIKNAEWLRFLNQAHKEIAARTSCYRDADAIQIPISADVAYYDYDPVILSVEEVLLASTGQPLTKMQLRDLRPLQDINSSTGTPTHYLEENTPFRMMLYPTPDGADSLYLTVYRLPLYDFEWSGRNGQVLEPPEALREALIQGALMYAYQKRDADTEDGQRQAFHAKEFDRLVGKPVDYRTLEARRWNANLDTRIIPSPYTVRRRSSRVGWNTSDWR